MMNEGVIEQGNKLISLLMKEKTVKKYNSDWNELMPVITHLYVRCLIYPKLVDQDPARMPGAIPKTSWEVITEALCTLDIQRTWDQVVIFIEKLKNIGKL